MEEWAGFKWFRLWAKGRAWRNGLDSDSSGLDLNGSVYGPKVGRGGMGCIRTVQIMGQRYGVEEWAGFKWFRLWAKGRAWRNGLD